MITDELLKLREYRQQEYEAPQNEMNFIFSGCPEVVDEYPDCVMKQVLTENSKLQSPKKIKIVKAYRMGQVRKPKPGELQPKKPKPRSIFVTFSNVSSVHYILSQAE